MLNDHCSLCGNPREATVILAAGRGLKTAPCFEKMLKLADALQAQAVGTRSVLDLGWLPGNREVGLSGLRLAPDLYLAFGVSGANFHTIGMYRSGWIMAVNIDEKARIFRLADYCVFADAETVLDRLYKNLPKEPFLNSHQIRDYLVRQTEGYSHRFNAVRIND